MAHLHFTSLSEQNIRKHILQIVGVVLMEWHCVLYFIKLFKENTGKRITPSPRPKDKSKDLVRKAK